MPECGRPRPQQRHRIHDAWQFKIVIAGRKFLRPGTGALRQSPPKIR